MKPLTVEHLYWSGGRNGVNVQLATIVRWARARNQRHTVCFFDGRGAVAGALASEGLAVCLGMTRGWSLRGLVGLIRHLRSTRPDVIHLHKPVLLPAVVAYATTRRAAWVYTEHSPDSLTYGWRLRLFYALFRKRFARFIALNSVMTRVFENYGVGRDRIAEIPCVVSVPIAETVHAAGDPPRIGAIARMAEVKRLDLLLDVADLLRTRNVGCALRIFGTGPASAGLAAHARSLGFDEDGVLAGPADDVVEALDQLDVFVFTSQLEVFGSAALEAMARGVPIVAMPARGGLADTVERCGIVLRDRSVAGAAAAVARLLASSDERRRLQERGLLVAREYAPDVVLPRQCRLYEAVSRHGSD